MPFPVDMSLHNKSRRFDIAFDDGAEYRFSYEFYAFFRRRRKCRAIAPEKKNCRLGK